MSENIFRDEWLECLRAHYMHVIRTNDRVTLPSLTVVMGQAGFIESELAELRVRATMHIDQVGADFVPDMHVLESVSQAEENAEARTFAGAEIAAEAVEVLPEPDVIPAEEVVVELPPEEEIIENVVEDVIGDTPQEPPPPDDAPKQLSLF